MVTSIIHITCLLLPLLIAAASAAVMIRAGQMGLPFFLAVLGGALLGQTIAFLLRSTAVLTGTPGEGAPVSRRRRLQLERDKLAVLRSIKEIELDAAMERISAEDAAKLAAPLRRRALRLLQSLDEEALNQPLTAAQQIDQEVARRARGAEQEGNP